MDPRAFGRGGLQSGSYWLHESHDSRGRRGLDRQARLQPTRALDHHPHEAMGGEPARGDIVVVLSPEDGTRLVKRIVGIPGDTIAMKDNQLLLNGEFATYSQAARDYEPEIAETLRPHAFFAEEDLDGVTHAVMGISIAPETRRDLSPVTVPADRYFLMGDSRDNSHDSRVYGFAERDAILGQAKSILVSLDINDTYLPRLSRFFTPLR